MEAKLSCTHSDNNNIMQVIVQKGLPLHFDFVMPQQAFSCEMVQPCKNRTTHVSLINSKAQTDAHK